ncbi:MAG TPA: hypothetical protein VF228_12295 [Iamia sp.]
MTRLSDALRSAADEPVDLELDLDVVHARVDRRRRRRVRARAGACVAAAALALGGIGLAAGAGDGGAAVRAGEADPALGEETTEPASSSTGSIPESTTTTTATTTTSAPAPTASEPAPTTSTAPPPSTAPPSPTEPAPTTVTLRGTYDVRSGSGGSCPSGSFPVRLAGTIDASDGGLWARTEQGCATLVDDVYDATGTFVLTAPDGSTLTGTFRSIAALPTDGVPYGYEVTGGTGSFAGAAGACDLTVRIVEGGGLDQRQEGEITCEVTVAGPASASSSGPSGSVPESV